MFSRKLRSEIMYKLSNKASQDLSEILEYSLLNHGVDQAEKYMNGISSFFDLLEDNPCLGHDFSVLLDGIRRCEYERHIIFYCLRDYGVYIVRVLHQKTDPFSHIDRNSV